MTIKHKTISVLTFDEKYVVTFGFSNLHPKKLSGTDLLLQNAIIRLFTSNGSNGYDKDIGCSLYGIISGGYETGQEEQLRNDFNFTFKTIEEQMKEEQFSDSTLNNDEKLESLILKSVNYNKLTYT